jgi:hypothetical protein
VTAYLEEATRVLRTMIVEKGSVTGGMVSQITTARDAFNEEFAVAEAMATQPQE